MSPRSLSSRAPTRPADLKRPAPSHTAQVPLLSEPEVSYHADRVCRGVAPTSEERKLRCSNKMEQNTSPSLWQQSLRAKDTAWENWTNHHSRLPRLHHTCLESLYFSPRHRAPVRILSHLRKRGNSTCCPFPFHHCPPRTSGWSRAKYAPTVRNHNAEPGYGLRQPSRTTPIDGKIRSTAADAMHQPRKLKRKLRKDLASQRTS